MPITLRSPRTRIILLTLVLIALTLFFLGTAEPAHALAIGVTTTTDELTTNGQCSLREAISNINDGAQTYPDCQGGAGYDTIVLPGGDYRLNLGSPGDDVNLEGDLDIRSSITVQGAGATATAIISDYGATSVAGDGDRIFDIHIPSGLSAPEVTIEGVTIRDGKATGNGGGIQSRGNLEIIDSEISYNSATGNGGGIETNDDLTLTGSSVANNTAAGAYGGGIAISGTSLTVTNSVVSGNTMLGGGEGGGLSLRNVRAKIGESIISSNYANGRGGAVEVVQDSSLVIYHSTINDNTAQSNGGGFFMQDESQLSISYSTVSGNISYRAGGGVFTGDPDGGQTKQIFGVYNSTISGNMASNGGGLFILGGTELQGFLTNVTITDNAVTTGVRPAGGLYSQLGDETNFLRIVNTIIADQRSGSDCYITLEGVVPSRNSLDSDGTCPFPDGVDGNIENGNAGLFPLVNNGGPTKTHAIGLDSDALNAGDGVACVEHPISSQDQRGETRPAGGACDIGAYELTGGELTIRKMADPADGTDFEFSIDPDLPFNSPPSFELAWGNRGGGPTEFNQPDGIGLDSAGNVYVADKYNRQVKIFDNSGNFIFAFGSVGSGDGEFLEPYDVAVDSAGNIFVVDRQLNRVQKFDSSGSFIKAWGTSGEGAGQFREPRRIAIDSGGNVFVLERADNRVQKFDNDGSFLLMWGKRVKGGSEYEICTAAESASCGRGWIGFNDGEMNYPEGLAVDPLGNVLVADTINNRIQKFNNNGVFLTKWGDFGYGQGELGSPEGVAADANGNVYVLERINDRVQKFDSSGRSILTWGNDGSGNGQFSNASDLIVDADDNVFVSDTSNQRIQKFTPSDLVLDHSIPDDNDGIFQTATVMADAGVYDISEFVPDGWRLLGSNCVREQALEDRTSATGRETEIGTLEVQFGEAITCTVENDSHGDLELTKQSDPEGVDGFSGWVGTTASGAFPGLSGIAVYREDGLPDSVYVSDQSSLQIAKYDNDLNPQLSWGGRGRAEGEFGQPNGVAVDSKGNVYVVDTGHFRVQKFDKDGNFLRMWGKGVNGGSSWEVCTTGCSEGQSGTDKGEFASPRWIAVDSADNIIVSDDSNHRMQKFDSDGSFLLTFGYGVLNNGNSAPEVCTSAAVQCYSGIDGSGPGQFSNNFRGVATNDSNPSLVYITDGNAQRVQIFNSDGVYQDPGELDAGSWTGVLGVATDTADQVLAINNNNIRTYSSGGTLLHTLPGLPFEFSWLIGLVVDDEGTLFATGAVGTHNRRKIVRIEPFMLDDGDEQLFSGLLSGDVRIVEELEEGWRLVDADCGQTGTTPLYGQTDVEGFKFFLQAGVTEECTISNVQMSALTVAKETTPGGGKPFDFLVEGRPIKPTFVQEWGQEGTGPGEFNSPSYIAEDGDGNVFVSDDGNDRIQKFDAGGNHLLTIGGPGAGAGQFELPSGLTVYGTKLYVSDSSNDRLQIFDLNGTFIEMWGWGVNTGADAFEQCTSATEPCQAGVANTGDRGAFSFPRDVAADSGGNIFVVDRDNHRVQKFNSSGVFERMWGYGVDTGAWVFEICTATPCYPGQSDYEAGAMESPKAIAVNSAGDVYINDQENYRLQVFSNTGDFKAAWGWGVATYANAYEICTGPICGQGDNNSNGAIGQFDNADGLDIDDNDHVYVVDGGYGRVQKFDKDGNFLSAWGTKGKGEGEMDDPEDIAVGGSGNIFIVDEDNDKVLNFATLPNTFVLGGGESRTYQRLMPGEYRIEETNLPAEWVLDDIVCENVEYVEYTEEDGQEIAIGIAAGQESSCVFKNSGPGPVINMLESFAVTRVNEGQLTGEGSKACLWVTSSVPLTGEVTLKIDDLNNQLWLSKRTMTLDGSNWDNLTMTTRSNFVCIRALDDRVDDSEAQVCKDGSSDIYGGVAPDPGHKECGDHVDFVEFTIVNSTDPNVTTSTSFASNNPDNDFDKNPATVTTLLNDNDKNGVSFTGVPSALALDEDGAGQAQACYWVTLDSQPQAPVTVALKGDGEVSVTKNSIELNGFNWNATNKDNKVCITAVNENSVDRQAKPLPCVGDVCGSHLGHVTHTISSDDAKYGATTPFSGSKEFDHKDETLDVIVSNDDEAGLLFKPGTLNLLEGDSAFYDVVLSSQPANEVIVKSNSSQVTFQPGSWDKPQTVTVATQQDDKPEGPETVLYKHVVRSSDGDYNRLDSKPVAVLVVDDDTPGIYLSTTDLTTSEDGKQSGAYDIRLTSAPKNSVRVVVATDGQLEAEPSTVTFTNANWRTPQRVTISAVNDAVAEEAVHSGSIMHDVASEDKGYDGLVVSAIAAVVVDNDKAEVKITASELQVAEDGKAASYGVLLDSKPTGDVVVNIDGGEQLTTIPVMLTFTPQNWNRVQSVSISAVDDAVDEGGSHPASVSHRVVSVDSYYDGSQPQNIAAEVLDNDAAGVRISTATLTVPYGAKGSYSIVLNSQPVADVVIDLAGSTALEVVGDSCEADEGGKSCLLFTAENWEKPQSVTVRASGPGRIEHQTTSADAAYNEIDTRPVMVNADFELFMPLARRK